MDTIKAAIMSTVIGLSTLGATSCRNDKPSEIEIAQKQKLVELMGDRPVTETEAIFSTWRNPDLKIREADIQSSIDSVAFKNFYEGSKSLQDSPAINRLNLILGKNYYHNIDAIPAKNRITNISYKSDEMIMQEYDNKMKALGITNNDFIATQKELNQVKNIRKNLALRQFKVDSMAYEEMFNSIKPMTDSVRREFVAICKKIKP